MYYQITNSFAKYDSRLFDKRMIWIQSTTSVQTKDVAAVDASGIIDR